MSFNLLDINSIIIVYYKKEVTHKSNNIIWSFVHSSPSEGLNMIRFPDWMSYKKKSLFYYCLLLRKIASFNTAQSLNLVNIFLLSSIPRTLVKLTVPFKSAKCWMKSKLGLL